MLSIPLILRGCRNRGIFDVFLRIRRNFCRKYIKPSTLNDHTRIHAPTKREKICINKNRYIKEKLIFNVAPYSPMGDVMQMNVQPTLLFDKSDLGLKYLMKL